MDNDLQGNEAQNESVFVSYDKLRSFASMDILWSEITGNPGPSPILTDGTKIEFETVYNMTLDDLKCALEKAYDVKMSTGLFAAEWLWPVCNYCFDMLGLADLYEDPRIIPAYHVRTIPEDENDVLKWAFSYISESVADEIGYGRDMNLPLSGAVDIRGILDMISVSTEDEDTDPLERDYPDVFMRDYIMNLTSKGCVSRHMPFTEATAYMNVTIRSRLNTWSVCGVTTDSDMPRIHWPICTGKGS